MKLLKPAIFTALLFILFFSCAPEEELLIEEHELKRMPFNEQVFFLDKQGGWSHVYKVDYDFQGLQGNVTLTPFVKVKGGSHMTVSPPQANTDERYLTIVNNGKPGKIHLVNVNNASDHRVFDLYKHSGLGDVDINNNNRVKITQVDYDENNFLFIAGKDGFFRVSADYLDMSPNVWSLDNASNVWAIKLSNIGGMTMEDDGEDDGGIDIGVGIGGGVGVGIGVGIPGGTGGDETEEELDDYFGETADNLNEPRFIGGDILFTQNDEETAGFESERLISVTQGHGNAALWVQLEFGADSKAVSYSAKKLFNLMKVTRNRNTGERGIGKVTGAALVGDNHLMTSHHLKSVFEIRNLNGELLASPSLIMNESADLSNWEYIEVNGNVKHNWGDMASVQRFDTDFTATSKTIPENVSEGYYPMRSDADLAEVKLYRPGSVVLNSYEVGDDNPEVSKEARRNSSNSDIADLRKKPYKFTSLGKENGYMILKFNNPIPTDENTVLQVVETSWNTLPEYETSEEAYSKYPEQASVYVSNYGGRYIGDWVEDDANWVKVGDAFISNNTFSIPGLTDFQWVKIVDDNSKTPDGFDVNFVSAYQTQGNE